MKIQIQEGSHTFRITLPTGLLRNRWILRTVLKRCGFGFSGDAAEKLLQELNRIQKRRGHWDLVEVYSAEGETVTITI